MLKFIFLPIFILFISNLNAQVKFAFVYDNEELDKITINKEANSALEELGFYITDDYNTIILVSATTLYQPDAHGYLMTFTFLLVSKDDVLKSLSTPTVIWADNLNELESKFLLSLRNDIYERRNDL